MRELGLRPADWGPVYAVGAYATAHKYDGDTVGLNCELFFNDSRMSLARYPNGKEFMRVSAVHDVGDAFEFPEQNYYPIGTSGATIGAACISWINKPPSG